MEYSKEAFENTQAEVDDAEKREKRKNEFVSEASFLDRVPLTYYYEVAGAVDYLRGRKPNQLKDKLKDLYEKGHAEALELEAQREALENAVVQKLTEVEEAVRNLKEFESDMLRSS